MSTSLRSVLSTSLLPATALGTLPVCANPLCPRPQTLWQRWWARNEGITMEQSWYCSPACFDLALSRRIEALVDAPTGHASHPNRMPLGLVLLSQGLIDQTQLRGALDSQREAGTGKIGEWLVRMGAVSETDVIAAVAVQQGCPVFTPGDTVSLPTAIYVPASMARHYRALPVFYNAARRQLYVGFIDTVDHGFLHSLEQLLKCQTRPCIVPPTAFERLLERQAARPLGDEVLTIQQKQSAFEMKRMIGGYAEQTNASLCTITRCGSFLWTRLSHHGGCNVDLLFHIPGRPAATPLTTAFRPSALDVPGYLPGHGRRPEGWQVSAT